MQNGATDSLHPAAILHNDPPEGCGLDQGTSGTKPSRAACVSIGGIRTLHNFSYYVVLY